MTQTRWVLLDQKSTSLQDQLLFNRSIRDPELFFHPTLDLPALVDSKQLQTAVARIRKALENKETIFIYGDFDVDGVTATAILWETLDILGATVFPYIPHREKEGYGLSETGLAEIKDKGGTLVITVDCGVSAVAQAILAKEWGLDLIITDHHQKSDKEPEALAILHTYELCGAGIAYELAQALYSSYEKSTPQELLELACIGTVADMVPLNGKNRALVFFGLKQLNKTKRLGLKAILEEAAVLGKPLGVFDIGFIIAPRLNAMGRLEHAYDSLRILLTRDPLRARALAQTISLTNQERQRLTKETIKHAQEVLEKEGKQGKLFILHHESWQQGIIGLVAGRLTDQYCRPVLIISKGETYSKGSARSIAGFNIVEAIRSCSDILVNCGGHPGAAGFTIETGKIDEFKKRLSEWAQDKISDEDLIPIVKIEAVLTPSDINRQIFDLVAQFSPFGMSNPDPTFMTENLFIDQIKLLGAEHKHLKLMLHSDPDPTGTQPHQFETIGFGMGPKSTQLRTGQKIDIAYTISLDTWNGKSRLVLKLKDLHPSLKSK